MSFGQLEVSQQVPLFREEGKQKKSKYLREGMTKTRRSGGRVSLQKKKGTK